MYQFKYNINYTNFFRFDKSLVIDKSWSKMPPAAKSIYPVIAVHCNKEGLSFPSQLTIAILSGTVTKTVRTGIEFLKKFPGIKIFRTLSRGHVMYRYQINITPFKRGSAFALYKCIFEGGHWMQLSSSAHALYVVMRALSFFDSEEYCEIEDLEYGYDMQALIAEGEFQKRKYDFVDAETKTLAEYAGICPVTTNNALKQLEESSLIQKTPSIRGYETWKIFRTPEHYYDREFLNSLILDRYNSKNKSIPKRSNLYDWLQDDTN